jgi:uncharacterized protein YjbJ (UPF0337 family)
MERKWNEMKALISEYWSKISPEDVQSIEGREDQLLDLVQNRYECSRQRAERDMRRFFEIYQKLEH